MCFKVNNGNSPLSYNQTPAVKDKSSINDNVLDLNDKSKIVNELNNQDINKIKFVKISDGSYINLSDPSQKQALINQLKSKLINSSGNLNESFSAATFQENTGIKLSFKNETSPTSTTPQNLPQDPNGLSLPPETDLGIKFDKVYYSTFFHPGSDKSGYVKAQNALDSKISEIDSKLSALPPDSSDKTKLEYFKSLYSSMKNVYSELSKPHSKNSADNFTNALKNASDALKKSPETLKGEDIVSNNAELNKLAGLLSDYQNIAVAYLSLGGKSSNASGRLNEFTAQTFERLSEIQTGKRKRKDETKDIPGAIQTFKNDISDMKVFIEKLNQLSKDLNNGKFDNNKGAYIAMLSSIAPKASTEFKNTVSNLGSALYDTRQAQLKIEEAARNQQAASNKANQANQKLDETQTAVQSGNESTNLARTQSFKGKYQQADNSLTEAMGMKNRAQSLIAEAKQLSEGANADLNKARANISEARGLISRSNSIIAGVESGTYGGDLKEVTGNAKKQNATQTAKLEKVAGDIALTQSQLNEIASRTKNLQSDIDTLGSDIEAVQKIIDKGRDEQLKAIRESQGGNFLDAQNWTVGTDGLTGIDANKAINEDYDDLDKEFLQFMDLQGDDFVSNWMTFGKFASREAGSQIQNLETSMEALQTLMTTDGNTQNDIRAIGALITTMDSDNMIKQSILMSASSMGIDTSGKSSTQIIKEIVGKSYDSPSKILGVVDDLKTLHTAMVKGNTEIHANIAPAYKIFLKAEKEGKDGIEALKAAGYGNVTNQTFVAPGSKDPQGLVLSGFMDYKKGKELEEQAKIAERGGDKQKADKLRAERNELMYKGSLKFGAQEQMAILQGPQVFGNPKVATILKSLNGTMSIKDSKLPDGTYRNNPIKPEGTNTGWADFPSRMGLREASNEREKAASFAIRNEQGEVKYFVLSKTDDSSLQSGNLSSGSDGTISKYFYDNMRNKDLYRTKPRDMGYIYRDKVEGAVGFSDKVIDTIPGSTTIPLAGKAIKGATGTIPKQTTEIYKEN